MDVAFSSLPSVWIAQLTATLGESGMYRIDQHVLVSDLAGLASGYPPASFAVPRDWRISEGGLYPTELSQQGPLRWTRGDAHTDIPYTPSARDIEFRLYVHPLPDRHLRISINGENAFDGEVAPGDWIRPFPLPPPRQ